jgi:hypothetical protein
MFWLILVFLFTLSVSMPDEAAHQRVAIVDRNNY